MMKEGDMRILLLVLTTFLASCGTMEYAYQRDMDRVRMQDVHAIADAILLYQKRHNSFPFQQEAVNAPVEVFISDRQLPEWLKEQMPKTGHSYRTHKELQAELRTVEGEGYILPSEPQRVETFAPNFYQYHVQPDYMCVSANLYFANKDTQSVQGQYHKYQLCAKSDDEGTEA